MARELGNTRIVIGGTDTTPSTCDMDYRVADSDLHETVKNYSEPSPNFNQQVDALCPAVGTTVKTAESI